MNVSLEYVLDQVRARRDYLIAVGSYLQASECAAVVNVLSEIGTPNYCAKCSPKGFGYCKCEFAANE